MTLRRGVTLIELLVVVGVIAILLSIALPGLAAAREGSRSHECQGRLRQLAVAAQTYATASREVFPAALLFELRSGVVQTVAWDFVHGAQGSISPGPLWSFTDHPFDVHQCPSFLGASTFGSDPATGFNYNTSFIGAEGSWPITDSDGRVRSGWDAARKGLSMSQHRRPSETAMIGDGGWQQGANKFMRAPSASVEMDLGIVYGGAQAYRHQGCTNVAWLDGHVRGVCQQCEGMHATDALLRSPMGWPRNGFLSQDDRAYDPR